MYSDSENDEINCRHLSWSRNDKKGELQCLKCGHKEKFIDVSHLMKDLFNDPGKDK
jgi:hypothetical protein